MSSIMTEEELKIVRPEAGNGIVRPTSDRPTQIAPEPCKHGNPYFCGLCDAERAPKCKHGNPFYCGWCGPVTAAAP